MSSAETLGSDGGTLPLVAPIVVPKSNGNGHTNVNGHRNENNGNGNAEEHIIFPQEPVSWPVAVRRITMVELAKRFNVSSKTISRWKKAGLETRDENIDPHTGFLDSSVSRKRVVTIESAVQTFIAANADNPRLGTNRSTTTQLTTDERNHLLDRMRECLHRDHMDFTEAAKTVAKEMNRCTETIRYTVKNFDKTTDKEHRIVTIPSGPLSEEAKATLYQRYRSGVTVAKLSERYSRGEPTIKHIINKERAKDILANPDDFIDNKEFRSQKRGNADRILAPTPEPAKPFRKQRVPAGLPSYLATLYETPLLEPEQEQHLFRKMNFLKHQASLLCNDLDSAKPKKILMDQIEELRNEAVAIRSEIVQRNLRLVVSIMKNRTQEIGSDFYSKVSDGNLSLIRAAEKFDYGRGFKFSTYASWAIKNNDCRAYTEGNRYASRFNEPPGTAFEEIEDRNGTEEGEVNRNNDQRRKIDNILTTLNPREQDIIRSRYGLNRGVEPKTLKEVGADQGVTKERIRQIEAKAMDKLKLAVEGQKVDFDFE